MRLNCAIFDMDGTVLDSMGAWFESAEQILTSQGVQLPEDFRARVRHMHSDEFVEYSRREFLPQLTRPQASQIARAYMTEFYTHRVQAKAGAKNFLSLLKMEGVQCYLATATDRDLARKALTCSGLEPYFKGIITSKEVGKSKSQSPAIYQWAMKRMGGSLLDTVVFEDALFAIKTAKQAGFRVAGVYDVNSQADQEEIRALSDYYITSFEELYHRRTME